MFKQLRKMVKRVSKNVHRKQNKLNAKVMELNALEKLILHNTEVSDANLKIVYWNARNAVIAAKKGNRTLNKLVWLKTRAICDVVCVQESFSNEPLEGYNAFHGLRRFAQGKPAA